MAVLRTILVAFALLSACFDAVFAAAPSADNPVAFQASAVPAYPHPGEVVTVTIKAKIAKGWHLYSLIPTPPPGPSPAAVTLKDLPQSLTIAGPVSEDAPVVERDSNFDNKQVAFHENSAAFSVPLRVSPDVGKTAFELPVSIHYQTCNNQFCLPPTSVTLSVTLAATAGPIRPEYANPPPATSSAVAAAGTSVDMTPQSGSRDDLFSFLLAAFGAGLLALLTPCVFPLIPVTFGFFTKQVGGDHRRLIGLAGAYALGIIVSFTALGLVAALLFGAAGANRVAANPWFNLFFGVLFVVFALSFFEAIVLRLPAGLSGLSRPATSGIAGVLLMGLAFVFAAFTCTAPFIGTVLVAAASATGAQWARPLLGMACFAVALALPFFLLALFPGLLAKLPRSGGWLTTFKAVLGFVELAYALTYFSKADLVWQAHLLTSPVLFALWAGIAIACGLYLLGLLRVSAYPEEPSRPTPARRCWAAVFGAAGIYCLYALTGRPVSGLVLAYLPPEGYGIGAGSAQSADDVWLSSYQEGLAQARASGKPVFIDFTGYTCTNCRFVEQSIFTKPPVKELLADRFTRVRLYTDDPKVGDDNQALQQKLFHTLALPLYAVVSADGEVETQLGGSSSTVEQFASFMEKGEEMAASPLAPVNVGTGSPSAPMMGGRNLAAASKARAQWTDYSTSALGQAKAARRPVIVDFTATWCTNCHALEKHVFTAPAVSAKLGGFTTLRSDLTDFSSVSSAALEKQYGIVALPAVLFLDSSGKEVPNTRVTGIVTAADFAARMDRVVAKLPAGKTGQAGSAVASNF